MRYSLDAKLIFWNISQQKIVFAIFGDNKISVARIKNFFSFFYFLNTTSIN